MAITHSRPSARVLNSTCVFWQYHTVDLVQENLILAMSFGDITADLVQSILNFQQFIKNTNLIEYRGMILYKQTQYFCQTHMVIVM